MAEYIIPESPNLAFLDKTTPLGTEASSKLDDALRQTRAIFYDVLSVSLNPNGTIKSAIIDTDKLTNGGVTSDKLAAQSVINSKLGVKAVKQANIDDDAVGAAQLAADSVVTASMVDDAVTTAKIADNAVTVDKIANGSVTAAKLAGVSITAAQIANGTITGTQMVNATVTVDKLAATTSGAILAGTGSAVAAMPVTGVVRATVVGANLEFAFSGAGIGDLAVNYALLAEKGNTHTSAGGDSVATTWNTRPVASATTVLTEIADSADLITIVGQVIKFAKVGKYLIRLQVAGYGCGKHAARIKENATSVVLLQTDVGLAPAGTMNTVSGAGIISVTVANTEYVLQHWTELATVSGLGVAPGTAGGPWGQFVSIEILQLSTI